MENEEPSARPWHEVVHEELKRADVRLVTYVPDNVLSPLIRSLHKDDHFTTFCAAREEEAVGIATGAWMGEFNLGQNMVWRTMRPALDSLGIEHHTIRRQDEVAFVVERTIRQAVTTQAPAALILNPLLTGGKTEKARH